MGRYQLEYANIDRPIMATYSAYQRSSININLFDQHKPYMVSNFMFQKLLFKISSHFDANFYSHLKEEKIIDIKRAKTNHQCGNRKWIV